MEIFDKRLHVSNYKNFNNLYLDYVEKQLREDIFIHIVKRKNEDDYIDLDYYSSKYGKDEVYKVLPILTKELEAEGEWKTKLSFGDTGLFIYSTDDLPKTCW
jgi:hypothetical protein